MKTKYAGSEWLTDMLRFTSRGEVEISDLGKTVADVLGQVYRGLYHIQDEVLHKRVDWSSKHTISIVIRGGLYSYDSSHLTELIVLCYDNMLRLEVNPRAPAYLELRFHRRETRNPTASIARRLPALDDMITMIREDLGLKGR